MPWVVESNLQRFVKRDLFNCIDLLALRGTETLAIQVTSGDNHAARCNKILANEYLARIVEAGWIVEVWSYRKGANGRYSRRQERLRGKEGMFTWERLYGGQEAAKNGCAGGIGNELRSAEGCGDLSEDSSAGGSKR